MLRIVAALTLFLVLVSSAVACDDEPQLYSDFRQTRAEQIPGTWGLMMSPPDEGWNPQLSPAEVLDRFAADTPRDNIMLTLAEVSSSLTYVSDGTPHPVVSEPAWVFLSRGVCFSSEKGALVASARRPDSYGAERCSMKNISVLAVNADTGEYITTERAFDETEEWQPARAGDPVIPGASPTGGSPEPRPASRASEVDAASPSAGG